MRGIRRRDFLATAALAPVAVRSMLFAPAARYRVGITTNTRGGWENDVFLSFREAREVGYRNVESFIQVRRKAPESARSTWSVGWVSPLAEQSGWQHAIFGKKSAARGFRFCFV